MAIKHKFHIYVLCVPKTTFFGVFLNHQVLLVQVHYIGAHPCGVKQCNRCYSPSANIIILYLLSADVLVVLGSPVIIPPDIPVELRSLREFVILVSDDVTCSHPEIDRSNVHK